MKRRILSIAFPALLALPLRANGRRPPEVGDLSARTGLDLSLSSPETPPTATEPLTAETAVQTALTNSRRVQALLREAAVARADRRRERTLPGPDLEASLRRNASEKHTELAVLGDVNGVLLYPWKAAIGNTRYRAALGLLAAELADRVLEVRTAYYRAVAAEKARALSADAADSFAAAAELSRRQRNAGTMSALDLAEQEAAEVESRVSLESSDSQALAERERLARALGLPPTAWTLPDDLPALPAQDPDAAALQDAALARRNDLAAAQEEASASSRALSLSRLSFFPSLRAGVYTEKDQDGQRLTGPAVSVQIPLFDLGSAARLRAGAERDAARHNLAAMRTEVPSEVRVAHRTMTAARHAFEATRDELVPQREKVSAEAQKRYNFMLSGVYQLLAAKRAEASAWRSAIEAQRDYWIARAELEKAAGGPLPAPAAMEIPMEPNAPATQETAPTAPAEAPMHHHHGGNQ
ncbi:MAG: TolC family protein [Elusimicrobia bacterium]|nr:TolC family protein [Elusimicrobiota bacterium]